MISNNELLGFIGIDYSLIKDKREANMTRFYVASGSVLLILFLTFLSVFYAFDLLFHKVIVEFMLASFFSLMLCVMYIFLIQTFSKESISQRSATFINISNASRISFVLFLGFIVSKPIEAYMLEARLSNDIITYKSELKQSFDKRSALLYAEDIRNLQQKKEWYENQLKFGAKATVDAISNIDEKLTVLQEKIEISQANAAALIDNSDFFLERLSILCRRYFVSWLICFVVISLFALPVYLIYSVSGEGAYYREKKLQDKKLVWDSYREFKIHYSSLFKSKHHKDVNFYEAYENPPFTKNPKKGHSYNKQQDLFNKMFPSE